MTALALGTGLLLSQNAGRVRTTYEFIKAHRGHYSVQALCRVLDVAPSGYYDWLKVPYYDWPRSSA